MKSGENAQYEVGNRIDVAGERGSIMYIGEVSNTEGIWLGIDWDNPERGKHDGIQMGVRYFTASHPLSGSFVRPQKVDTGITLLQGIENRYGEVTDAGLDFEKIDEVQKEIKAKFFQILGADKLNKQQSNYQNLQTVVLHGTTVSKAGPPGELLRMCPNIQELHLGKTLLSSWRTVYEIVCQLKNLQLLDVSSNRLVVEDLEPEPFDSLKHVVLAKLAYNWDDALRCCAFMLNLEVVQLPYNNITTLREPPNHVFTKLKNLDLEGNRLESWDEVNKLGTIRTLVTMNLINCGLKEIHFPCSYESKTSLFESLENLAINNNLIDDWVCISELDKLKSLVELKFRNNPVLEKENWETNEQLIIARILNLKKINGSVILAEDRNGADIDYHKRYAAEYLSLKTEEEKTEFFSKHPCYIRLLKQLGEPDINLTKVLDMSLGSKIIQIEIFSPQVTGKSYFKKVPNDIAVEKLAGLTQRLFNTGCEIPKLSVIHIEDSKVFEFPIENYLQKLDFYSICDGDKICVRW